MSIGLEGLKGRVVLLTGAASGIGCATAAALVDVGARVHAADFRAPVAEATGLLTVHQLDVTDAGAVEALVDRIGKEAPLDALVCCAGTNIPERRLEHLTDANWRLLLETNLTGVFSCIRAAMPQLRRTRGHVVVISSVSAQWPDVSGPAYQASKAGVLALVRAAAFEEHAVAFASLRYCPHRWRPNCCTSERSRRRRKCWRSACNRKTSRRRSSSCSAFPSVPAWRN